MMNDDDIDVLAQSGPMYGRKYIIPPDAMTLPPLASLCGCEMVVNDQGLTVIMYDKPLPEDIEWAEYDADLALLTFVTWSGKVMDFGLKIHVPFRKYLKMAQEIVMIYMENGTTPDIIYPVKLVNRHMGF